MGRQNPPAADSPGPHLRPLPYREIISTVVHEMAHTSH